MKAIVALFVFATAAVAAPRDEALRMERELLDRGKKNSLTWEHFPLRTYPQWTGPSPKTDAIAERIAKRLIDKREEFTKKYLRGRLFGGPATIKEVARTNGKYVVTATQRFTDEVEAELKKMEELDQFRAEARYATTGRGSPIASEMKRNTCTWVQDEPLEAGQRIVLHGEIDAIDVATDISRVVTVSLSKVKIQAD